MSELVENLVDCEILADLILDVYTSIFVGFRKLNNLYLSNDNFIMITLIIGQC